jgi:hypothetical protein
MELIECRERIKEQRSKTIGMLWSVALSFIFLSLLLAPYPVQSQTWDEIFKQKETQKKYLLEQIASLKIYAGYLKKGYDIAGTGLQTIKDFSNGEFNLHRSFISSLKKVSPAIRNNVKVAEIIAFQIEIKNAFKDIRSGDYLSPSCKDYIQSVRENIMKECSKDLEELLLVVTSGRIEMTDDERMKRLDKIYESMLDKSAFTQSFCNEVNLLILQKVNEKRSVNQIKNSYGIIN